jgi:hypothetical protein
LQKGFWVDNGLKVANVKLLSSHQVITDNVELGLPLELKDIWLLLVLVALYIGGSLEWLQG